MGNIFVCPICLETIVEATESADGQDAIFCESTCNTWLHRKCAGITKMVFKALENSESPFYCVYCRLKAYEAQFAEYNSIIKGLQKQVDDLERKVANKPGVYSEMVIEHQVINGESVTNQHSDSSLSSKNVVESKAIDAVKSLISEEKDKANRRLNVIIHNVAESSASEGLIKKEHDMEQLS